MLRDLLPLGPVGAARVLGVEPMDVIRIAVLNGKMPTALAFDAALIDTLRATAAIESGWWAGVSLPADANPHRARVRAAVQLLLDRAAAAGGPVRMDNLWRDLSVDDQALVHESFEVLGDEELVVIAADSRGVWISVADGQRDVLQRIADGKQDSAGLTQLWQG